MNIDHSIIKSYIVYIQNIYENLGSTTTFEDLNPINQIIYNNLNILSILLIHVINNYEMYNLFNNNISIINNDIYNLTTSSSASSSIFNNTYQIIYLPDISLMADSTRINLSMSSVLTYNQIITYLKGVLKYNINYTRLANADEALAEALRIRREKELEGKNITIKKIKSLVEGLQKHFRVPASFKDATLEQMQGLIEKVHELGRERGWRNLILTNQEMQEMVNYYEQK
jgi:hypothetical protein